MPLLHYCLVLKTHKKVLRVFDDISQSAQWIANSFDTLTPPFFAKGTNKQIKTFLEEQLAGCGHQRRWEKPFLEKDTLGIFLHYGRWGWSARPMIPGWLANGVPSIFFNQRRGLLGLLFGGKNSHLGIIALVLHHHLNPYTPPQPLRSSDEAVLVVPVLLRFSWPSLGTNPGVVAPVLRNSYK